MIFCAVKLDDGLVNDMKAFTTKDKALKYFNDIIAATTDIDRMDGEVIVEDKMMYYRYEYGNHDSVIVIHQVDED